MKTLDEVIKALEYCTGFDFVRCQECPGFEEPDCGTQDDALYYLKMYRSDKALYEADRKYWEEFGSKRMNDYAEATIRLKEKFRELDIGTLNDPLTWDELREMEGKPVWVEALLYKQWAIIAYVGVDHIRFEGANLYAPECRVYMGADNGWLAYRKEPIQ